jgi:glycosyltransferase involved in cell wall biosynthesis
MTSERPVAAGPRLSVVVPLYRSEGSLPELFRRIGNLHIEGGLELVLVNDGSPDATSEVCRRLLGEFPGYITFVDLCRNFGEHNAVITGLRYARGAYIVTMDDDLQNPPEEAVRLLEEAEKHRYDVVYSCYTEKKHERWRNLGSAFANRVADFVLDKPPGLYLSSFRCMSSLVASAVCRYEGPYPYIDGLILQSASRIGTLEVGHDERSVGQSGYDVRKLLRLWSSLFLNFSVAPLRVAGVLGATIALLGFLDALMVIGEWFFFGTPPGWGSLMCAILVLSGTQLLMIGLVGEYLGRVYLTVNRCPQAVVREVIRHKHGVDRVEQ